MSIQCTTCGDNHRMWLSSADRYVPCTKCRTPCRDCASNEGRGAYCEVADCHCECHHWLGANERSVPPPEPPTRVDLVSLLRRWRDLDAEPHPGEGLVSDGDVMAEHAQWRETYEALTDATDRALAAEARRPTNKEAS